MADKCTRSEYTERIKEVECLLLDGIPRANLLENTMQKYKVGEGMVRVYITEAYKRISAINKATIDENKGWVLRNFIDLFKRARSANELSEERACLTEIGKILGLYKTEVNHNFEAIPDVKDDDLREDLRQEAVH